MTSDLLMYSVLCFFVILCDLRLPLTHTHALMRWWKVTGVKGHAPARRSAGGGGGDGFLSVVEVRGQQAADRRGQRGSGETGGAVRASTQR